MFVWESRRVWFFFFFKYVFVFFVLLILEDWREGYSFSGGYCRFGVWVLRRGGSTWVVDNVGIFFYRCFYEVFRDFIGFLIWVDVDLFWELV